MIKCKALWGLGVVLWLWLAMNACTQVDKTLGSGVISTPIQPINIDTLIGFVSLRTVPLDSLATSAFASTALGRISDARFGKTRAGFAAQFEPIAYDATSYFSIADYIGSVEFDSLALIIKFSGTFGTNTDSMNVEVYELDNALDDSATYYGSSLMDGSNVIYTLCPTCSLSKLNSNGKIAQQDTVVRIILDNDNLRQRLQNAFKLTDMTEEVFVAEYLKGLYITVSEGDGGCIKYTSPVITSTSTSVTTALWAYFHYEADSVINSVFPYLIYSTAPCLGVYEHESINKDMTDDNVYVQGLHGVSIEAKFNTDSVRVWKQGKAVNRVELVLNIADNEKTDASLLNLFPSQMSGLYKGSDGYSVVRDVNVSTFNGNINRSLMQYSLNITHFFEDINKGNADVAYFVPATFYSAMSYGVLNKSPMLKVTYSNMTED